tara:strand:- start:699 stop:1619 length:921 start_codon:yes stop_codon:yes gene_type:complete
MNLKGNIEAKSEEGIGSLFKVQLPLALDNYNLFVQETAQKYVPIISSQETTTEPDTNLHLPKVLIVDNNIETVAYLNDLLSTKLNLSFAYNREKGLELAKQDVFNLIISDFRTLKIDDAEFQSVLNPSNGEKSIPFLILTTETITLTIEEKLVVLGNNKYLTKPFKNSELINSIDHLLENSLFKEKMQNISEKKVLLTGSYAELMEKINTIVLNYIIDPNFSVVRLAQECGYSQQHFTHILKTKAGLTPGKVILEIRLLKAHEFIIGKKFQTMNEVIYAVGLSSRTYFNKVFLKRFGDTPKDLMRK